MGDEMFERGEAMRRAVLGDAYVDAALTRADPLAADFQRFLTEYCWGATWGREGVLTRRDRSLLTLMILGTLGRASEFKLHLRAAIGNGCTRAEIAEALQHLAVYAGVPAGVEAFRLTREVLAEMDHSSD
jgi:4-carboxymuconolactone decarboxylase